jgi:hypothetical protein
LIELDDSLIRAAINYLAFFKLQDILMKFKNESVPAGFAPTTVASPLPTTAGDVLSSI